MSIYYYMVGMNQEFDRFLMACLIVLLVTQVCSERLRDLLEYVPLKKGSGHIQSLQSLLHCILFFFIFWFQCSTAYITLEKPEK